MGFAAAQVMRFDDWHREGPAPVLDHRRFGPLRASLRRDSDAFVWECLDLVQTARGPADLEFEAGAFGPGALHEKQLDAVVASLDALTRAAADAISKQLSNCLEQLPFLEWQGARLTGREGAFRLHYWNASDALIAVQFAQSRPTSVLLHD